MSKLKYLPPHLRKKKNIDQDAITKTDARQKSVSSYFLENCDVNIINSSSKPAFSVLDCNWRKISI